MLVCAQNNDMSIDVLRCWQSSTRTRVLPVGPGWPLQFLLQRSKQNLNSTVGKGAVKRAAGSEGFGFLFYHEPHVSVHHDVYAWEHLQLPHGAVLSGCLLDTGRVCGLAVAGSVCGTRWLENPRLFGNSPFRDTDLIFFHCCYRLWAVQ